MAATGQDERRELGDRDRHELGRERHDAQRDRQRGGGRRAHDAGEPDDEHRVARAEAGRQQRQQDARDPRQAERAEQQERAGGGVADEAVGEEREPGRGDSPAGEVDRDHLRERALAQRPRDRDTAPRGPARQPVAEPRRAQRQRDAADDDEQDERGERRVDAREHEAGDGRDRARDDRRELLVAGGRQRLGRRRADAVALADAVGEADDAAGLVAQDERPRPDAQRAGDRRARTEPAQRDAERPGLQQGSDGHERDRARQGERVDRPVDGGDRLAVVQQRQRQPDDERDAGDDAEVPPRPPAGRLASPASSPASRRPPKSC